MKLMLDLNILLDVVQRREPHYAASASILNLAYEQKNGCFPAHAVTTLRYLVARHADRQKAGELVDWLLLHFTVAAVGTDTLKRARALDFPDFEDAVVSACAEQLGCSFIITRNCRDFARSSVTAVTPEEFLAQRRN